MIPAGRQRFAAALACSVLLHLLALASLRMPPPSYGPAGSTLNLLLIAVPRWSGPSAHELPAAAPAPAPQPLGMLPAAPSRPQGGPPALEVPLARRGHAVTLAPASAPLRLPSRLSDAGAYLDPSRLTRYPQLAAPFVARYPRRAMEEGQRGAVRLQLMIDERGAVTEAQVVGGDPVSEFAEEALAAARAARFTPAEAGGRPVKARAYFSVYFVIE